MAISKKFDVLDRKFIACVGIRILDVGSAGIVRCRSSKGNLNFWKCVNDVWDFQRVCRYT